jgi:preprotein translocase subunit SecF
MKIPFIKLSKIFLPISIVLVVASVIGLFYPGPRLSIEFTGGTLMELVLPEDKTTSDLEAALDSFSGATLALQNASIARTREGSYFIRSQSLSNEEHLALVAHLHQQLGSVKELQFNTIGPTVGQSLKQRALLALGAATLAIIAYIALAFRKIPRKLSPWRFGMIAVIALLHDIFITVGIFTVLSYFTTFQVDTLFISALLSIMGYSVNDTIVIFDRIRENLQEERKLQDFGALAELSLQQTVSRTINTGLGALIMLFALFFLGSESIRWFILTLIIGTIIGTYSSFFIATPLLVYWRKKTK